MRTCFFFSLYKTFGKGFCVMFTLFMANKMAVFVVHLLSVVLLDLNKGGKVMRRCGL